MSADSCDECGDGGWLIRVGVRRLCAGCAGPGVDLYAWNPEPGDRRERPPDEPGAPHDPLGDGP